MSYEEKYGKFGDPEPVSGKTYDKTVADQYVKSGYTVTARKEKSGKYAYAKVGIHPNVTRKAPGIKGLLGKEVTRPDFTQAKYSRGKGIVVVKRDGDPMTPGTSAFGVVHEISKGHPDKKDYRNAALIGGGTATAGVGLVGGGIPGVKDPVTGEEEIKRFRETKPLKEKAKQGWRLGRKGIFGYRETAHQGAKEDWHLADRKDANTPPNSANDLWRRNMRPGKLEAEQKIIRHMRNGRSMSTAALAGGALLAGAGLMSNANKTKRERVKKNQKDADKYSAKVTTLGGGAAAAGFGIRGALKHQQRKWNKEATFRENSARRYAPRLEHEPNDYKVNEWHTEHPGSYMTGKDVHPASQKWYQNVPKDYHYRAAVQRGKAKQAAYFARTYGKSSKIGTGIGAAGLGVAAIGAGGLMASHRNEKGRKR